MASPGRALGMIKKPSSIKASCIFDVITKASVGEKPNATNSAKIKTFTATLGVMLRGRPRTPVSKPGRNPRCAHTLNVPMLTRAKRARVRASMTPIALPAFIDFVWFCEISTV